MSAFNLPIQIRWSDLDPNFHLRHSVYYDWGAMCRIMYLGTFGLTPALMEKLSIGPVLFREECVFKREVRLGDKIHLTLELMDARRDFSRWTIRHSVVKNDEIEAASITVEGSWLDTKARKLAVPPAEISSVFKEMPVSVTFKWSA
jgi:acyl-CoA thioester hydrolase